MHPMRCASFWAFDGFKITEVTRRAEGGVLGFIIFEHLLG